MRRGVRMMMRRGSRVSRPTILFQSRDRALPEKGAIFVVVIFYLDSNVLTELDLEDFSQSF